MLNVRNGSDMSLIAMAFFSDGEIKVLTHIFLHKHTRTQRDLNDDSYLW